MFNKSKKCLKDDDPKKKSLLQIFPKCILSPPRLKVVWVAYRDTLIYETKSIQRLSALHDEIISFAKVQRDVLVGIPFILERVIVLFINS